MKISHGHERTNHEAAAPPRGGGGGGGVLSWYIKLYLNGKRQSLNPTKRNERDSAGGNKYMPSDIFGGWRCGRNASIIQKTLWIMWKF